MLLHKTLAEIVALSPLEIEVWRAYLGQKREQQEEQKAIEQQRAALASALRR